MKPPLEYLQQVRAEAESALKDADCQGNVYDVALVYDGKKFRIDLAVYGVPSPMFKALEKHLLDKTGIKTDVYRWDMRG